MAQGCPLYTLHMCNDLLSIFAHLSLGILIEHLDISFTYSAFLHFLLYWIEALERIFLPGFLHSLLQHLDQDSSHLMSLLRLCLENFACCLRPRKYVWVLYKHLDFDTDFILFYFVLLILFWSWGYLLLYLVIISEC